MSESDLPIEPIRATGPVTAQIAGLTIDTGGGTPAPVLPESPAAGRVHAVANRHSRLQASALAPVGKRSTPTTFAPSFAKVTAHRQGRDGFLLVCDGRRVARLSPSKSSPKGREWTLADPKGAVLAGVRSGGGGGRFELYDADGYRIGELFERAPESLSIVSSSFELRDGTGRVIGRIEGLVGPGNRMTLSRSGQPIASLSGGDGGTLDLEVAEGGALDPALGLLFALHTSGIDAPHAGATQTANAGVGADERRRAERILWLSRSQRLAAV